MNKKLTGIAAAALCGVFLMTGCGPTPSPTASPTITPIPTPVIRELFGDTTRESTFGILAYQPTNEQYLSDAHINGTVPQSFMALSPDSGYEGDYAAYLQTQKQALTAGGKLILDTRSVYYNVRFYNKNREMLTDYISNILTLRQFAKDNDVPFYTLLSSGRITPGQPQSATTLSVQAFLSLGLGASGVAWGDYQKDMYAPLDEAGGQTDLWYYLQDVNRRLGLYSNVLRDLNVECVYFQTVGGAPLPTRPLSSYVQRVQYNIKSDISGTSPLMLVELSGAEGSKYLYVVNLSTTQSAYPRYMFRQATEVDINNIKRLSPATGNWHVLNVTKALNAKSSITEIGVHDTCITAGSAELYRIK